MQVKKSKKVFRYKSHKTLSNLMKNITNNNYYNSVRDRFRLKRNNHPDVYFKAKNVTIRFRTKSNGSIILFFFL